MDPRILQFSQLARQAVGQNNWRVVQDCARQILLIDKENPEGHFLEGVFEKQARRIALAKLSFSRALELDANRYDAAIELSNLHWLMQNNADALELLSKYQSHLSKSPHYLNFAGEIYVKLDLHELAYPLFVDADQIQPNVPKIKANIAGTAAKLGKFELAKSIYVDLLKKQPQHQRNHFELARLEKATDRSHIDSMIGVLEESRLPHESNIFMYFALAKELEDLGEWDEAYRYLKLGNDSAAQGSISAGYNFDTDIKLLNAITTLSNSDWIQGESTQTTSKATPIFIVGLPRTGTTLVERIIGSHSKVESAGESFFLEMAVKEAADINPSQDVEASALSKAYQVDPAEIMNKYLETIAYRLEGKPYFIEKFPQNFMYLGIIAKAMPDAKIVFLDRKPMDACFAMYKQPYFRYSYDLDWLAKYYTAFNRLRTHWEMVLGDQFLSVKYEDLVHDPESHIRKLLVDLGLEFEQSCVDFHLSKGASATASFAQIRQKAHKGSVNKWVNWREQLDPLKTMLDKEKIDTSLY